MADELKLEDVKEIPLLVKWSGKEYSINELTENDTVGMLKHRIFIETNVRPERQKLLNLKFQGKFPGDEIQLLQLKLKSNFKILMMGSLEEDIETVNAPCSTSDVIDDFDEPDPTYNNDHIYQAKIERRIRDYKINVLNESRPGKKLLVLDIDYTLFDHRSVAESANELMRPYLHEFLFAAYEDYDIVIWSATSMKWIEEKMRLLGVSSSQHYKILFYLDSRAMISIYRESNRSVTDVKPLGVIWGKFPQYTSKNTIMFDDIRRNFLMNPKSGLKIKPFREAYKNRESDSELLKLITYLKAISTCDDFNTLNHRKWESYVEKWLNSK